MIPYEEFKKQFMNGNISVVSERGNRYYWLYGAVAVRTPYAKEIAITRMELSELYSKYVNDIYLEVVANNKCSRRCIQ